ncbi:hypothetical protein [Stenotrophomonas forensis]|uniref:hypothetical protein n=1 Tax=Stenotrophomonas forensis TaxID=2871169 RepID=UPI0039C5F1BE
MGEAIDHREVGRQLASMSGVELDSIAPQDARLWEARGQALQALAAGDMGAALRTMGMVSSRIMDRDEAWEIASNAIAVRIAAGWTRDMLDSSTEAGRAPCGRGYYLFCSGAIDEVIRLRAESLALRDSAQQATEQLRATLATN